MEPLAIFNFDDKEKVLCETFSYSTRRMRMSKKHCNGKTLGPSDALHCAVLRETGDVHAIQSGALKGQKEYVQSRSIEHFETK